MVQEECNGVKRALIVSCILLAHLVSETVFDAMM